MADYSMHTVRNNNPIGKIALRWGLYVMLGIFAVFYLMPFFVMLTTSLKSLDEIRTGDLISLPRELTLDAWRTAWSGRCCS